MVATPTLRTHAVAAPTLRIGVFCGVDGWPEAFYVGPMDLREIADESVHTPVRRLQAHARGLLVRRCLLPACVLQREVQRWNRQLRLRADAVDEHMRARGVADLYLRPTATRTSHLYCDRVTRLPVADALHLGIRRTAPRDDTAPTLPRRAPNARKAAQRRAAASLAAQPWRGVQARAVCDEVSGQLFRRGTSEERGLDTALRAALPFATPAEVEAARLHEAELTWLSHEVDVCEDDLHPLADLPASDDDDNDDDDDADVLHAIFGYYPSAP